MLQYIDITDPGDVAFVASLETVRLGNARIRLDAFRDAPIDPALLAELERGFDRVRRAGLKLVLRFQYNNGSGADPPLERVLQHLDQLAPIVARHADVIAVLQAGFIGAWGEWHNSISGLTARPARSAILGRLLEILPASRSVQVRSPVFKTDAPVAAARIGHHNDCLLGSDSDRGTYPEPVDRWRAFLADDSRSVPVGGESCLAAPPRTGCTAAIRELRAFHWSYVNRSYHPDVVAGWRREGCMDEIARDLGYRLVVRRASWPREVAPRQVIDVELAIENLGYAAPFNPREVALVVGSGDRRSAIPLPDIDPRRWSPGQVHRHTVRIELPGLDPGDHPIALWLPDPAPMLRPWPAYAIRLSNRDLWRAETGDNRLGWLRVREGR
jgi:hypothetical protein